MSSCPRCGFDLTFEWRLRDSYADEMSLGGRAPVLLAVRWPYVICEQCGLEEEGVL